MSKLSLLVHNYCLSGDSISLVLICWDLGQVYRQKPSQAGSVKHIFPKLDWRRMSAWGQDNCHWWNRIALHWRHNDHDVVSNHQPHGYLLNRLFRRRSKKTSKLRVTGRCVGNSPGPVKSPHKGPVTRKMLPFDDVIMCPEAAVMSSFQLLIHALTSLVICGNHWSRELDK